MRKFAIQLGILTQVTLIYWCYGQRENKVRKNRTDCSSNQDICYALLKISGGVIIPQEPTDPNFSDFMYCRCKNEKICNTTNWEKEPRSHITFYHHERVDWQVQFKFCALLEKKNICEEGHEVAGILHTNAKEWTPSLVQNNCRCPNDLYFMKGWRLFTSDAGDYWEYKFKCARPQCEEKEPCLRHYVDRSALHTVAYEFYCSCDTGWYCPLGVSPIKSYEQEGEDKEIGPYVHGYCDKLAGWGSTTNDNN